jgi:hypothetical protein
VGKAQKPPSESVESARGVPERERRVDREIAGLTPLVELILPEAAARAIEWDSRTSQKR